MKYLIDTSVLIAWVWEDHEHHWHAESWGKDKTGNICVCPLSEIAFLRIATSDKFGASIADARQALKDWWEKINPKTLPADLRALDASPAPSSKKVFDWYFADLAVKHGMKWATLDDRANHPAAEPIWAKRASPARSAPESRLTAKNSPSG